MLDWVTGASRSQQDDHIDAGDIPETPAHVFMGRAFKSLLFGTPAPNDMTTEKSKRFTKLGGLVSSPRRHSTDVVSEDSTRPLIYPRHSDSMASPSKGILVAPGSISTKRKSVTFGGLARELEALSDVQESGRSASVDVLPAPIFAPQEQKIDIQPADLRRTLFQHRNESITNGMLDGRKTRDDTASTAETENKCIVLDAPTAGTKDVPQTNARKPVRQAEEQTLDLNQPRSSSGQHWKREYERDHDNSKAEMKKLIQYNQATRSYAEKRDRDAIIMTQKLNIAESKAASLEQKVQRLAAQLMDANTHGDEQDSILGEVASQTAEIMKYKSKADRYRAALRKHEAARISTDDDEDRARLSTRTSSEDLRSELAKLRSAAERAEAHAARLEAENASLNAMLKEFKEHNIVQDDRYQQLKDRARKSDDRLVDENQRLSSELRKTRTENSTLREELRQLRQGAQSTPKHKSPLISDSLFDLSHSRFSKEATPPTSDEELRRRPGEISARDVTASFVADKDLNLTGSFVRTRPDRADQAHRRRSYTGDDSAAFTIPEVSISTPQYRTARYEEPERRSMMPEQVNQASFDSRGRTSDPVYDHVPSNRPPSPLMNSFVDNLGSRRALPPERIAAAKKRLEEKAANRRATPKYEQSHHRIAV